jgi:hypothetical protein
MDRVDPDPQASDHAARALLWERSIELVGSHLFAAPPQ